MSTEEAAVAVEPNIDDLVLEVASLKVVSNLLDERYRAAKKQLETRMKRGDRFMAWSPLGPPETVKIGAISMSTPARSANITDEPAFFVWVEETYPDKVVPDYEIVGSTEEIIAELHDHDSNLIKLVQKVDPDFVKEVRRRSAEAGQPAGPAGEVDVPGVEVAFPESVMSCLPDKAAAAAVFDLFRTDRMTLESLTFPEVAGGVA
jgi:hypothetical protein